MRQFLDVVYQAVEFPLRIHLRSPSEREAVELLVVPQIAEHRLHGGEALAVLDAPFRAVDAGFHFIGVALPVFLAPEERYLPHLGFLRREQAAITMRTRHAIALRTLKLCRRIAVDRAVAAVTVKLFSRRTGACPSPRVVVEIFWLIARGLSGFASLVVDRVGQHLVFVLFGKALIAAAHVVVGDQRIDFQLRQLFEVGF